jgi:hypothetical protein
VSRYIKTEAQAKQAEKVVSLLEAKVKRGIATPEEIARYRDGVEHLAIWDWGTESYQNYVPNMMAREDFPVEQKPKALPAPPNVPDIQEAPAARPPLKRRAGRFAV